MMDSSQGSTDVEPRPIADQHGRLYRAFDLTIRSTIPLVAPVSVETPTKIDVEVSDARLEPKQCSESSLVKWLQIGPERGTFWTRGLALFEIESPHRVRIFKAQDGDHELIEPFLLGRILPALLCQRGLFTLHASSVSIDSKAIAFAGVATAGKSTLALSLLTRGHQLIADDLTAIEASGRHPLKVRPAYPELKVSLQSIHHFGLQTHPQRPFPSSSEVMLRWNSAFAQRSHTLHTIYLLERASSNRPSIEELAPSRAVAAVLQNFFGASNVGKHTLGLEKMISQASAIASIARVRVLRVVEDLEQIDRVTDLLEDDLCAA